MPEDPKETLRGLNAVEEAEQRAFMRGQAAAVVQSRLDEHDKRLGIINGSIDRAARNAGELATRVDKLVAAFEKNTAIVSARAEDARNTAKEAADKQVSTRTFIFGLVGAVTAIAVLVLGALGHG